MVALLFVAFLLGGVAEASVLTYMNTTMIDLEEFKITCPETGYKVHGFMWSRCSDGKRREYGCTFGGQEYNIGDEFTDDKAKYKCTKEGNYIMLLPIACIRNGKVINVGEKVKDGKFYMQCQQDDKSLRLVVTGCSDQSGNEVPVGASYRKKHFVYECKEGADNVYEEAVGCELNGELLKIGEQKRSGDFYVKCERKGKSSARLQVVGCADTATGELMKDGERTGRDQILYECKEKRSEKNREFNLVAVGCLAKDYRQKSIGPQEFLFGQKWHEKYKENVTYTMQCREKNGRVGPKVVACNFFLSDRTVTLSVGCGTAVGSKAYLCKKVSPGKVMARATKISKDETAETIFAKAEVKQC